MLAAIDEGVEDFERGDHMDGFELIAQMRAIFIDELEETFRYICTVRTAGVGWPTEKLEDIEAWGREAFKNFP